MKRDWCVQTLTLRRLSTFFLVAVFFSAPSLFAGTATGADFLKIPIGAEPAGLGEAYTALAHGINALNWNPAGILQTPSMMSRPSMGLSVSHQDQLEENNLDHLGLIVPNQSGKNSVGFDLIRLSYADQVARTADREAVGQVSAYDMAFGAAMAHNFGRYQVGTQLKVIRQELAGKQADGFAVDMGLLSATPSPRLVMGLAVRNLGPQMRFVSQSSYALPLTFSLGSAYRVTRPLTLAVDVHYLPQQRQTVLSIGSQFSAGSNFTLRAGYLSKLAQAVTNSQTSETNRGNIADVSGLAGGMGFQFRQFNLDYSLTPFGELGNTQMLTLSTWFGETLEEKNNFGSPDAAPESLPVNRVILILPVSNETWWGSLRP